MERESREHVSGGPAKANALLFYHLARFVVWGQQHKGLMVSDHELQDLLCDAAAVLADAGVAVESHNI